MGKDLRGGCISVAIAALLVLAACSSGGGTTSSDEADNADNNPPAAQPADPGGQTDPLDVSLVSYKSCHDQAVKQSEGNSDGIYVLSVNRKDGAKVTIKVKSSTGAELTGEGVLKDGEVAIRVPLAAFGEGLDVTSVTVQETGGEVESVDQAGLQAITDQTVSPTSDCTTEDEATADEVSPN
jgi:hypothetical protein